MAEELQGLLEKINKEGLEKAELEKKSIIEAAEAKAAEIVEQLLLSAVAFRLQPRHLL